MRKVETTLAPPAQALNLALKQAASLRPRIEADDQDIVPSKGFGSPYGTIRRSRPLPSL